MKGTLHTDGAARRKLGEPTGPAGIGAVLRLENGKATEIAAAIGMATNNVAEYEALIQGLQMAFDTGVTDLGVYVDSPVVYGHLRLGHRVKAAHLRPLVEDVRRLLSAFPNWSLTRVPRSLNREADECANRGIDEGMEVPSKRA